MEVSDRIEPDRKGGHICVRDIERALHDRVPATKPADGLVPAAVLILVRDTPAGAEVLLTRRSDEVKTHKGQVSFPGGAIEPDDPDALHAALRETAEEVGLDPQRVRVLGRLDDYVTITGYHVVPWVAAIDSFEGLSAATSEIVRVFPFPLGAMRDASRIRRLPVEHPDGFHELLFVDWDGEVIWGATARILAGLMEAIR